MEDIDRMDDGDVDTRRDSKKDKSSDSKRKSKSNRKSAASTTRKLEDKLAETKKENEELKERLLRRAAEFENYKRRTEAEISQHIKNANAYLILQLLPILDDFERCLNVPDDAENEMSLRDGVSLIFKNFIKVLDDHGVRPIQAVGEPFDPEKHEALMQIDSDDYPSGTIVDEHLKGYVMNDKVLRHSQVLVSK